MKQRILIWGMGLIMILSSTAHAAVIGTDNEQVKQCADPIIDNILQGMANDDYPMYIKDFDNDLRSLLSKKRFVEKRKEVYDWVGSYLYREYLGFINTQGSTIVFWKGTFDKTKNDILIRLTLSQEEGRYLVKGLFYQ
ncbi:MAG: hypothetical protein KKD05_04530 [Candidatus Omnitrophica bacterium]|nr:hypothetical protein [Candidatus Omnitrophota bacterium]